MLNTSVAGQVSRTRLFLKTHWLRIGSIVAISSLAGWRVAFVHPSPAVAESDLLQLTTAARMWLAGQNPYTLIGPGLQYDPGVRLFYPFTAVLAALPFSFLPGFWPEVLFVVAGSSLFLAGISRDARHRFAWVAVASASLSSWRTWSSKKRSF